MFILHIILLSLIQGFTEFLPISSSAHLILFPYLLKISDQGIIIDISAHIGSLFAVLYFYKNDFKEIIINISKKNFKLLIKLTIATLPILIFGTILFFLNINFRNPKIIIYTSIIFGILFYISDIKGKQIKNFNNISYKNAFFIGLSQILSLIPGVSRSGITTTTSLFSGITREASLKFSFLLSVPTIIFAGIGGSFNLLKNPENINITSILLTILFSFISSITAIKFMLCWIKKSSFKIFALYRIILGVFLYFYLK